MRLFLSLLTAAALMPATAVAGTQGTYPNCTPPAIAVEAQSWVYPDGDGGSGREHVHTGVCFDFTRSSVPAGTTFTLRTLLHDTDSHLRLVRYAVTDPGPGVVTTHTMDVPGQFAPELTRLDDFTTNTSYTGEFRFTSDARAPARWFTTTRFQGDSSGRFGAAGWCEGKDYTNVYLNETDALAVKRQTPVPEPWTIRVKAEDELVSVLVDPNFHAGSRGLQVAWRVPAGNVERSFTVPTQNLAPGVHRLVMVDTDNAGQASPFGECSGVLNVPFVVQ